MVVVDVGGGGDRYGDRILLDFFFGGGGGRYFRLSFVLILEFFSMTREQNSCRLHS